MLEPVKGRRLPGADKGREGTAGFQGVRRFMDLSEDEREGLVTGTSWTTDGWRRESASPRALPAWSQGGRRRADYIVEEAYRLRGIDKQPEPAGRCAPS